MILACKHCISFGFVAVTVAWQSRHVVSVAAPADLRRGVWRQSLGGMLGQRLRVFTPRASHHGGGWLGQRHLSIYIIPIFFHIKQLGHQFTSSLKLSCPLLFEWRIHTPAFSCSSSFTFFFFLKVCIFFFKFIYLWLCWVFVSVLGLSLVVASGGHSPSRCAGLSLAWLLLLRSTGSRRAGSVVVAHGPSCSAACGIFPDQGSNPCPLHRQAGS